MISDAERSKIAQKLREDMELCVSGGHYCFNSEVIRYLCGVLGFRCSECRKLWKCLETLADLIEPSIDRDALLALADEMDERKIWSCTAERTWSWSIAHRIRKALGVQDA